MARTKHRFWRILRLYFRGFRIAVWFLIFLVVSALVYLNQVGLPDFAKKPLLDRLRQRGVNLQFSRMRLRWYEGIVADNARFARSDEPLGPRLTMEEIQLLLNWHALTHFQLQLDSLALRKGRLVWPIAATNESPRELSVDNIETRLRFLPDDQWELDRFKASFAGARIQLSGIVTNASAVGHWSFVQEKHPEKESAAAWQSRLRSLAETLEKIHFAAPPELTVQVNGDARDLQSFAAVVIITAPAADTPWGEISGGKLEARVHPAPTNGLSRAELTLQAARANSHWAVLTNFVLHMNLSSGREQTNLVSADLALSAEGARTEWASANRVNFTAAWLHSLTNPIPVSGRGRFRCEAAETPWGTADGVEIDANLLSTAWSPETPPNASWAWWTNFHSFAFETGIRMAKVRTQGVQAQEASCELAWKAPDLVVSNLSARLSSGEVGGGLQLDIATRALRLALASSIDPRDIAAALPESGRRWLTQFQWDAAPRIETRLALVAPAWTNRHPDWRSELLPSLALSGRFDFPGKLAYQDKLAFTFARSHVEYSNQVLHLPDIELGRPEGGIVAEHRADVRTREFYWHAKGTVDPNCVRPFLDDEQQKGFQLVSFTQPPSLDAEIWGRYDEPGRLGLKGTVAVTNFSFRGESIGAVQTGFQFSNQVLQVFEPRIQSGTQEVSADGLAADFAAQLIFLTNGVSSMDPGLITRVIGPHVARAIQDYRFLVPPAARVHGTIPMHGEDGADLQFDLDGGPFEWWKFKLPHINGHVHWMGQKLTLTDVRAAFYGGQAAGLARFDFTPEKGTGLEFAVGFTNVQLHALMGDLSTQTNHLEGSLDGALSVTKGNSDQWQSINGYGELRLRDGLLWDLPLFGVVSPMLNGISPGLGNSRASAASCGFVITNGFLFSNDLEIRSTAMRLKYFGTVDLLGRVNARVEAELLRDMWAVGPFVSAIFWPVSKLFEYKVSNTLEDPKTEPVFLVPKLVLFPFHPLRTLKNLLPDDTSRTNSLPPPR